MRTARPPQPDIADLRADIARVGRPLYKIAALASIHPAALSLILHERKPLTVEIDLKVREALRAMATTLK